MPYLNPSQEELPYVADSETSRGGAVHAQQFAKGQQQRLLAFYVDRGDLGATDEEVECALLIRRSSICARRNELRKAHLIEKGDTRRGTSGVSQQVWRIR